MYFNGSKAPLEVGSAAHSHQASACERRHNQTERAGLRDSHLAGRPYHEDCLKGPLMDSRESSFTSTPPAERAVSLVLEAEVTTDLDTGRLALIASTDHHMSDLDEVSSSRLRDMVVAARKRLVEFERLADEQEARETLQTLLTEHRLHVEEWDTATLDPRLRDQIQAVYDPTKGDGRVVIVPAGQDPITRLSAVRDLIADMRGAA